MLMTTPHLLLWIMLYLSTFAFCCRSLHQGNSLDIKVLKVGEELERETLPLKMGQQIYQMDGLEESVWYEVKISYPASIPASFSIQITRNAPHLWVNKNRRLLNTEKAVFKYDSQNMYATDCLLGSPIEFGVLDLEHYFAWGWCQLLHISSHHS